MERSAALLAFLPLVACSNSGTVLPPFDSGAPLVDATALDSATSDAEVDSAPPTDSAADGPNDAGPTGTLYDGAAALPKYVTPLTLPPVWVPTKVTTDDAGATVKETYAIDVAPSLQQVLPDGYVKTPVFAYGGTARTASGTTITGFRNWPSATFEAKVGVPVDVTWTNALGSTSHLFPVDPTIHWADPNDAGMPSPPFPAYPPGFATAQSPIPIVTHLHGGEVPSTDDGFPLDWFLPGASRTTSYPNTQRTTTLWYHDHALGLTRLNVLAGLAGFYLLRDPADPYASQLPSGAQEVPIVFQDRLFSADGSVYISSVGSDSEHPYWQMEYFGDAIVVNGRTWPAYAAEPRQYRLRLLNGSNARFYHLRLAVVGGGDAGADAGDAGADVPMVQIGSEGGYLPAPVTMDSILLAPAERADVVVDLSPYPGAMLRFLNDAPTPYPTGTAPDPATTGQLMQFTVAASPVTAPTPLPTAFDPIPALTPDVPTRVVTLVEPNDGFGFPLDAVLNGQMWDAPVSELPRVGSTEDWQIVNLGDESHPIHWHLVNVQVVSRQPVDAKRYLADWTTLNGSPTWPVMTAVKSLDPTSYLTGTSRGPEANETGWKDTVIAHLGEVLTVRIRYAPTNATGTAAPGTNLYPFDPTVGPGYVWHCHIIDHEDNEMMRPFQVTK